MSYADCLRIEAASMPELASWLEMQADGGRFVLSDYGKGLLYDVQKTLGDACASVNGHMTWFEFKVEARWTGNLFLESWSDCPRSPGWLVTCRADYLCYYFRSPATLLCLPLPRLQEWAYVERRIYDYPEKEQRKTTQPNLTMGYVVSVEELRQEVPMTEWPGRVINGKLRWQRPILSASKGG
jgi:hypothetical protein